ncbi:CoA-transferase family III [Xylaria bambusicola]|uniref:CoA-transferase family III n=1 Tax=Xylaria bambusicola TaxID=326684 RepID=UPI002008AB7E|nr:CoA-transferase family III [Xylaria bambusicola]KAI0526253.1 CoA-transferase family III [Xylaria bambusicola]
MTIDKGSCALALEPRDASYSVSINTRRALEILLEVSLSEIPFEFSQYVADVVFESTSGTGDSVCLPCPLRQQEACAALKGLEGCAVAAISNLQRKEHPRKIAVNLERVACFLMSAYITTLDGLDKSNSKISHRLPDTDLHGAQSILYRRLSAGLYETRNPGAFYHIHGSLDATTTLSMIDLPAFCPGLTNYDQCIKTIENAVKRFSTSELESRNQRLRQAGTAVLTREQYRETPHGRVMSSLPPFTVQPLELSTPPIPFSECGESTDQYQCLSGIRVIELCRVIAGPTIGRSLAAHGASVLKVTSPQLPDVPFFQLDVNAGKHTTSLHLKYPADRAVFDTLLATADVILDGYRPSVITRLGYSPEALAAKAGQRGRGIIYVTEDCFGGSGVPGAEWAHRAGWQQIADCVTGVAWEQGNFMGLGEPVVPPFPMSDYGTGSLGTIVALAGLYRRATQGGSWICKTSLSQYNLFLLSLGSYPEHVQDELRRQHDTQFFALRHNDSVDEVGKRALCSIRRLHPRLFTDSMMQSVYSPGFGGTVRRPKEALEVQGLKIGHVRPTRPNGFDPPTWEGWEEDKALLND